MGQQVAGQETAARSAGRRLREAFRRRRAVRVGVYVAVALLLLGLLVSYGPRYLARYLLADRLTAMGIEHSGVETLRIDPWARSVRLGPVSVVAPGAPSPARLERFEVELALLPLLERRALIERVIVSGVEVVMTRGADGRLALNGIPLDRLLAPAPPPADAGQGEPWGAGLDELELRESRVLFREQGGGELEVAVRRLVLSGFRSWEPERPGRFELDGSVNDIALDWSGEARPFDERIHILVQATTDGAALPKITRFTGPLGLERRDGTYDSRLRHDLTLDLDGAVEGHSVGTVSLRGADYARADLFEAELEQADLSVDLRYSLDAAGGMSTSGTLTLTLGEGAGTAGAETRFGLRSGRVELPRLALDVDADRNLRLEAAPRIDIDTGSYSGPLELSVDRVLEVLTYLQRLSTAPDEPARTGLEAFSRESVTLPRTDVRVERLRNRTERLELRTGGGRVGIALVGETELTAVTVDTLGRRTEVAGLASSLSAFELSSGDGALKLGLSGSNRLTEGRVSGPVGELSLDSLSTAVERLALDTTAEGGLSLDLASSTEAAGAAIRLYEQGELPEATASVGGVEASLQEGRVELDPERLGWRFDFGATLSELAIAYAGGELAEARVGTVALSEAAADESLRIGAGSLAVSGLDATVTRDFIDRLRRTVRPGGESPVDQADQAPPPGRQERVRRIQTLLAEQGFEPGPADGRPGRRTEAAIRAFQQQAGLAVDGRPTRTVLAALERVARGEPDAPGGGAQPGVQPSLRLDRFALEDGATIRYRDTRVQPQVTVDTAFRTLALRDLDTADPERRAELDLAAEVNEFTRLEVSGWAADLGPQVDLSARARLVNLQLPPYSPYAAEFAGVNLQSGQLTAEVEATAGRGALDGSVDLDLLDVEFEPLSEEDAERLSETAGVPIGTAVALLQDSKGHIDLTLPLGGSVTDPEVDISSAINKAIGGALKRIFPPTLIAGLISRAGRGGMSFEPVTFAPGDSELSVAAREYADSLVELLGQRPKLAIDVCGRATAADLAALAAEAAAASAPGQQGAPAGAAAETPPPAAGETLPSGESPPATEAASPAAATGPEQVPNAAEMAEALRPRLQALAEERTRVLRRYLIGERGVDPARVSECRAVVATDDDGAPRAKVSL